MTDEINRFAIESSSRNRHLFRRVTEPRHEYIFEITSKHVVLRATLPNDVGVDRRDALDDAERSEKEARKAAEELQRRIYSCRSEPAGSLFDCVMSGLDAMRAAVRACFTWASHGTTMN